MERHQSSGGVSAHAGHAAAAITGRATRRPAELIHELVDSVASLTGPLYKNDEQIIELALEAVRSVLKDPYSAQFEDLRVVDYQAGKVVCGHVNAKNSYGGYVGSVPFVAGVGTAILYTESEYNDIERAANAGLLAACG